MITSLNHIPEEAEDDKQQQTVGTITETSYTVTEKNIELSNIQPKQTITQIEEISHNYMKRGGLNSDRLLLLVRSANRFKLNDRDQLLLDILKQDIIDLKYEENQNVAIYILRKKLKNELEVNFLNNVVKNLPFFSSSSVQETKDNAQFKRIVQQLQYRSIPKYGVIFNYGEKGSEFFTVVKGAAFCLVPDPTYKKIEQKKVQVEPIKLIEQKENETKAETTARNFLNTLAQSLNKKNKIENNVLNFVDIIRSQAKRKVKKPGRMLMRSTTKQLEEMFEEEEKLNDNLTDTEFLKQYYPGFILVKTFMPGESFGEIALITSQNRSATLVAKEDSDFMVLDKEGFDRTTAYMKKNTIREKIEFIKSFEFFSQLSTKRVLQLIQQFKIIKVNGRQNIYEEGDNPNFFFLIREGEVELQSRYNNPQELVKQYSMEGENQYDDTKDLNELRIKKAKINVNKLHTVKILGQNSYFGEEEIVKNLPKREGKAICKGQGAEIYAIEKKRLYQVLNYNIFDRFKDAVDFKDELKSERLKNAIKIQIPQKDISNLNEFLEKDKKKKEFEIQKEELKQVLQKKLKMNFSNRYKDQTDDYDRSKNKGSDDNINNISDNISDSDVQEYNRMKNLELQKKTFYRVHDKVNQIQKSTLELTPNYTNPNVIQPIFPVKEQRKSFRYLQAQTLDDYKMNNELKPQAKQTTPKIEIRRASKLAATLDNSLDEYIQKSARSIQIKSFTSLLEIEDKLESDRSTPISIKESNPQTETNIGLNDQGSGDETTKYKLNNLKSQNMTKTDKLILNLSKNSAVQRQLKQIKDQYAQQNKSKTPQPVYQMYNFQKSNTPQQNQTEGFSPQKQRLQNSSKKILRIAGTGLFNDEIGNIQQQNNYTSPISRPLINITSSNSGHFNKQIRNSQTQNHFHVRSSSKSQVNLPNQAEFSNSQIQLNNSHTIVTPQNNYFSQNHGNSNSGSSNQYRFNIGTFSIPSINALNSLSQYNSIQTTKQNSQQNTNKIQENKEDKIIQEVPVTEFNSERQTKTANSQQRRSLIQHNTSKDNLLQRKSILGSPSTSVFSAALDEKSYLKKPFSSRMVKKEIAPHKIRPITKLDNHNYFNSVLHHSTQDTVFKNITISQQQTNQVRSNSQIKGISQTPLSNTRTIQSIHKNPEPIEETKSIGLEQFKKRVSAQHHIPGIVSNDNHLTIQQTNSSSMSMLRFRRSILQPNGEDFASKTTRPISSHQSFNKSVIQTQQYQQPSHMQNISLAVLSSKYSDNRKIVF